MSEREPKAFFEKAVNDVLHKMAEEAVRSVLANNVGYGIDTEIKNAIRDEARKIVAEEDIRKKIREQLLYWIKQG